MHVRFSDTAENDLQAIHDHIAEDNPQAAQKIVDRLIFAAYQLGDFPFLGRSGDVPDTREWSVSGTSYFIVYSINDDRAHIDVETIIHTSRQYPPHEE
jgi:addiction module RelE/StbE family toxin